MLCIDNELRDCRLSIWVFDEVHDGLLETC